MASFVALSVTITLASIAAGQYVHSQADERRARHAVVLRAAGEISALASSADEEGFSFVVAGDPVERALTLEKLDGAQIAARDLASNPTLSEGEGESLRRVTVSLARLREAAVNMFDDFERDHAVPPQRYDAYDQAIDGASEAIAALDRATLDEGVRGRESSRRTSNVLTAAIGLLALIGAVLGGSLIARRIARPLVALRNAAIAFGAGRIDVVVAPKSADEVGELASAFERMAIERKHLEARLVIAEKLEALGRVAGSVAHDFNNVLGAVLSCSELALEVVGDDHAVSPDLRDIADAVRRGANLTRQLLAFSKPEAASPRILSVNAALRSIEPMLARLTGAQVKVHLTLDPRGPLVRVDATQLDQVLMNLVVNARDATPRGGEVEIRTSTLELEQPMTMTTGRLGAGPYVLVEVRDQGTGMDEATMARLFEPFFTTKEPGKGTGLGLATVLRVILQAGGAVALESALGHGTTFRVYLPLAEQRTAPPGPAGQHRTCSTPALAAGHS